MAARQTRIRNYGLSDLRLLMNTAAASAKSWDDVLRDLQVPLQEKFAVSQNQLVDDVRHLRDSGMEFTGDYRKIWKELTGENAAHLPAPGESRDAKSRQAGLESTGFPTADDDVIHAAVSNPSSRVLDVLRRVESREYRDMAGLNGSAAWNRKP